MVNSLENIDKSKVYVDRIEGLDEVVEDVIGDTLVGAVSTITTSDLTAGKILVSDANGKVAAGSKGINDLQDTLVSGTNIKTINNTSILGSGNIAVESGANTSLSNLTVQGQNIANWSNNVTNCITEIPQDIKLELSDGTLTLKAGSKVYVPNGAGVFDVVTIASDITTQGSDNFQYILFYYPQGGYIGKTAKSNVVSGPDGSSVGEYGFWYDTTNNIIKRKLGGVFDAGGYSLPFGLSTATSSGIQSIDQVFNGFGYIGSTVFALPGVKGLIPNGRNEDGSLKSKEIILSSVLTNTFQYTGKVEFYVNNGGVYDSTVDYWKYNEEQNFLFHESTKTDTIMFANGYETSGVISNFTPKTAFHAVDYNDFSDLKDTVDINDSNVVHKTGDEIITGHKIFTNNIDRNVNAIRGQTPSADSYSDIRFTDNNNNWLAGFEYALVTDKSSYISLIISDSVGDTTNVKGLIQLGVTSDGKVYTYSPASDSWGSIVTTESINKSPNGYVKLGNGLIIQWGITSSSNYYSATYPIPFSSDTSYTIVLDQKRTQYGQTGVNSTTPTGFTAGSNAGVPLFWIAIGY